MRSSQGTSSNASAQSTAQPALIKVLLFCVVTLMLYAAAMFVVGVLALLIIDDGPLWYGSLTPRAHSAYTESADHANVESSRDAIAEHPHFDPHLRQPATDNTSESALSPAHRLPRGPRGAATAKLAVPRAAIPPAIGVRGRPGRHPLAHQVIRLIRPCDYQGCRRRIVTPSATRSRAASVR